MPKKDQEISDNRGLIHKIAVLSKDHYTIATTNDLFIFAGADRNWWREPIQPHGFISERMHNTYGWIEGIKRSAPGQLAAIIKGVALQMAESSYVGQSDKEFLRRSIGLSTSSTISHHSLADTITIPDDVEALLDYLIKGLPRAMFPLKFRRKGMSCLDFDNEYDVQSLLHALLRPWIKDIRAEEYTPSYVGSSTRIDFLLPDYGIVCEVKFVRDKAHASKVGDELIIDIAHYRVHPQCKQLWIVIYDSQRLIANPPGLQNDLQVHSESIPIKTYILGS